MKFDSSATKTHAASATPFSQETWGPSLDVFPSALDINSAQAQIYEPIRINFNVICWLATISALSKCRQEQVFMLLVMWENDKTWYDIICNISKDYFAIFNRELQRKRMIAVSYPNQRSLMNPTVNTFRLRQRPFWRRCFQIHFYARKLLYFYSTFT